MRSNAPNFMRYLCACLLLLSLAACTRKDEAKLDETTTKVATEVKTEVKTAVDSVKQKLAERRDTDSAATVGDSITTSTTRTKTVTKAHRTK